MHGMSPVVFVSFGRIDMNFGDNAVVLADSWDLINTSLTGGEVVGLETHVMEY